MPIYDCLCSVCERKQEVYKTFSGEPPICCGQPMQVLISAPAKINVKVKGGVKVHSKGYKEGYAKDYRRRLQEAKS